ncbi:MAG: hypothetical protein ACI9Y7_000964 [Dokdonia sp.]
MVRNCLWKLLLHVVLHVKKIEVLKSAETT